MKSKEARISGNLANLTLAAIMRRMRAEVQKVTATQIPAPAPATTAILYLFISVI